MRPLHLLAFVLCVCGLAAPAGAQGRVMGVVVDADGKPVKGSTVRAINQDATPREWKSVTDSKGRWVLLGLRIGDWQFVAEAPGYFAGRERSVVRSAFSPRPVVITMRRDPGPPPGALSRGILDDIATANSLRDQGQLDAALTAYETIQTRNPKLTAMHGVIADLYRRKADQEPAGTARDAWLQRASDAERTASAVPAPK